MDEAATMAEQVVERLRRIEALEGGHAPGGALLGELRALVGEAEAWARLEGDERSRDAISRLRAAESGAEAGAATPGPTP